MGSRLRRDRQKEEKREEEEKRDGEEDAGRGRKMWGGVGGHRSGTERNTH